MSEFDPPRCWHRSDYCRLDRGHSGPHEWASPPAADPLDDALDTLLRLLPQRDEYAYIEARVGSDNYRRESRFVVDRRPGHYTNEAANEWLAQVMDAAHRVRSARYARLTQEGEQR